MLARLFGAKPAKPRPDTSTSQNVSPAVSGKPALAELAPVAGPKVNLPAFVARVKQASGAEHGRHAQRIADAVTGIFGPDAPDMAFRMRQALTFGRGVPRDLAPEMGFWMPQEIPDSTRYIMLDEGGFCELLVLHKAGAGETEALEGLEIIASLLEGFDLHDAMSQKEIVNGAARTSFDALIAPLRPALEAEISHG